MAQAGSLLAFQGTVGNTFPFCLFFVSKTAARHSPWYSRREHGLGHPLMGGGCPMCMTVAPQPVYVGLTWRLVLPETPLGLTHLGSLNCTRKQAGVRDAPLQLALQAALVSDWPSSHWSQVATSPFSLLPTLDHGDRLTRNYSGWSNHKELPEQRPPWKQLALGHSPGNTLLRKALGGERLAKGSNT